MACNKFRYRQRYCRLTERDEDDFTAILRENFSDLLILEVDDKENKIIRYDSISETEYEAYVCLPDPGWKPKFGRRHSEGLGWHTRFLNLPAKNVWNNRSFIGEIDLSTVEQEENSIVKPLDWQGRRFGTKGEFQGGYAVDNPEQKRFIGKFFRLSGEFMTNAYEIYNLKTGELVETIIGGVVWAGPDVIRLCREEENFVCSVFFNDELDTWTGYKAIPKP